jgi:glycosyltransferase involved in cell wall biosynthesis
MCCPFKPLLCCIEELGPLDEEVRDLGIKAVVIGRRSQFDFGGIYRLASLIRRERPHIVHSWLYLANVYGRLASKLGGAPVVIASVRGAKGSLNPRRQRAISIVDWALGFLTDCVIANSESVKAYVEREGIPARKIAVIHNGVQIPELPTSDDIAQIRAGLGVQPNCRLVGMVARLDPEFKDHLTFLKAASIVHGLNGDVQYLIVGDGRARTDLERLVIELGLEKMVIFTGYRSDSRRLEAAFDVSVLCSFSEGFSNVLLEAMSWGKPVVATDIPANREMIRSGIEGLLVPIRDPLATAEAIHRLLHDSTLAADIGEKARQRVAENFSERAMSIKTMHLYERLLSRSAGRVNLSRAQRH